MHTKWFRELPHLPSGSRVTFRRNSEKLGGLLQAFEESVSQASGVASLKIWGGPKNFGGPKYSIVGE